MKRHSLFYLFLLAGVMYASFMIWHSQRPVRPLGVRDDTTLPKYDAIPVNPDTFVSKLQYHLQIQNAAGKAEVSYKKGIISLHYPGGNIYRDFDITDTSEFYKHWGKYIYYEPSISALRMEFPVKNGSIDIPASIARILYNK